MKRALLTAGVAVVAAFGIFVATSSEAQVVGTSWVKRMGDYWFGTMESKVTSGRQALKLANPGAQICFDGTTECILSDGTNLQATSGFWAGNGDLSGVLSSSDDTLVARTTSTSTNIVIGVDNVAPAFASILAADQNSRAVGVFRFNHNLTVQRWEVCQSGGTNCNLWLEEDGDITVDKFTSTPQTHNVANDGAGTAPATTLVPTSSVVLIDYDDVTNGSVGTISEASAQEGDELKACHTGAGGTVVFTEVAGQQEIGATACTMALSDCFEAVYLNASWHFLNCRDN